MVVNQQKPYVIGLDLGGTNSVFGIVDQRGEIKVTTAIKTQGHKTVEDYVKASVEALQPIIDHVGGIEYIKAMGIGAPNANFYKGTIEYAPNLAWAHDCIVPLAEMFSKELGIPVALTNDANAAAIGEMTYEEMFEKLNIAIRQFAKRQMTWFRGMERRGIKLNWIDASQPLEQQVSMVIETWEKQN